MSTEIESADQFDDNSQTVFEGLDQIIYIYIRFRYKCFVYINQLSHISGCKRLQMKSVKGYRTRCHVAIQTRMQPHLISWSHPGLSCPLPVTVNVSLKYTCIKSAYQAISCGIVCNYVLNYI